MSHRSSYAHMIPSLLVSEISVEKVAKMNSELERLATTNRELSRENSKLSSKLKVVSASKVEKLLKINERLREELEKIELSVNFSNTARHTSKSLTFRGVLCDQFNQTTGPFYPYNAEATTRFESEDQKTDRDALLELKQQVLDLRAEKDEIEKKFRLSHVPLAEKKELEAQIKSLECEKAQLKKEIATKNESEKKLKSELSSSKVAFERGIKELAATIEKQQKEINFYRERLNELQPYVVLANSFQRERESLEKEIEAKQMEIADLKQRAEALAPLQKENRTLKQRYFIIRTVGELLKQRNEEQVKRMDQIQKLVDSEELLDTEIHLRLLMEERDVLAAQNERITKSLQEKILKLDVLQFKVSSELEEIQNLKKSARALDESQILTTPGAFRSDVTAESSRFREEIVQTLESRATALKGFQAALSDVNDVRDQIENMNRELKELNEKKEADSSLSDFCGFSKRPVAVSYTNF